MSKNGPHVSSHGYFVDFRKFQDFSMYVNYTNQYLRKI